MVRDAGAAQRRRCRFRTAAIAVLAATLLASPGSDAAEAATFRFHEHTAPVPGDWQERPPGSRYRVAEYAVPGAAANTEAECIVYFFGPGQGGTVDANVARWSSQFTDATGRPVVPARSAFAVDGMRVTLAEFTGSYARGVGSGPQGAFLPGQTLVAAIVETSRGNLIFQLHGPTATVAAQRPALLGLIRALTRAA